VNSRGLIPPPRFSWRLRFTVGTKIIRFEDYRTRPAVSPLMERALNFVELVGKSGFVTVPRDPTGSMLVAGMDAAGVGEDQARAIYRAMLAASDDEGVEA
jgi:hypothetical protein